MKGKWKKDGQIIDISAMDDSHLRNSIRFCWRKITGLIPTSGGSASYFEDKIIELGEEAQKRNWIPDNITYEQLLVVAGNWETEDGNRPRYNNYGTRHRTYPQPSPQPEAPPLPEPSRERNIIFDL
jgi:hypothetical protein